MLFFSRLRAWLLDFGRLPVWESVTMLRQRFREDRLGLTASSLTFTTTIALVPLITVALAGFTAFPMFGKFQQVMQKWLVASLVPDSIARQVLGYLNQFAGKASQLGVAGLLALLVTAVALVFTIDRTLNAIWRVRTPRPMGQRALVYWTALTLGPLLLGISLSLTSYAIAESRSVVRSWPGGVGFLLESVQFMVVASGMAALFHYVPNTHVRWGHAWMGGLFVSAGLEVAKKLLALYLGTVPTYSVVYGAFATVPILLVWIYVAWVIVLLGAALTAHVPNLLAGTSRPRSGPGWQFQLALDVLQQLQHARHGAHKGCSTSTLCTTLQVDAQRLEPILEALIALDWVGLLNERGGFDVAGRYVLLMDPAQTPLAPLVQALLLPRNARTERLWQTAPWQAPVVQDVL